MSSKYLQRTRAKIKWISKSFICDNKMHFYRLYYVFRFVRKLPKQINNKLPDPKPTQKTEEQEKTLAGPSGLNHKSKNLENIEEHSEIVPEPDSSDCSDSEKQHEAEALKPKRKRYAQKYQEGWKTQYPWLKNSSNNKAYCKSCNSSFSCSTSNIKRHEAAEIHKKNMKKISNTPKIHTIINDDTISKRHQLVNKLSLKYVYFYMNITYHFC